MCDPPELSYLLLRLSQGAGLSWMSWKINYWCKDYIKWRVTPSEGSCADRDHRIHLGGIHLDNEDPINHEGERGLGTVDGVIRRGH